MCAVFGLIDYNKVFTAEQRERILRTLSKECEVRGTDATGYAYNKPNHITVFKRPVPAHKLKLRLPDNANIIIGHTRMATQGDEKFNFNNHPFRGCVGKSEFALAHNGVLHNDMALKVSLKLPKTEVQTDSYIAVQLLEQNEKLDFAAISNMAEQLEGSFVFTILDHDNNVYFVKGDNPLCIYHFEKLGFYLYASTEEILMKTLAALGFARLTHNTIANVCGDIICIDGKGKITRSTFNTSRLNSMFGCGYMRGQKWWCDDYYGFGESDYDITAIEQIKDFAQNIGVDGNDIDILLEFGYDIEEIEEMLLTPTSLQLAIEEILGEYDYCY